MPMMEAPSFFARVHDIDRGGAGRRRPRARLPETWEIRRDPGGAGGPPWVISVAHHPSYTCAARAEARPRRAGGRTARFGKDCRGSLQLRLRMRSSTRVLFA